MAEKINPIILNVDGTEYTLEFSRTSVAYAEQNGFNIRDIDEKMMTRIPELFYYAFKMHHPDVKRAVTDRIFFDELGGIDEAVADRLVELYAEPYKTLSNDTGKPKNPKVTVRL